MKFDLHMHTARHSPDADSDPFELVQAAIKAGLDGIVITEHDFLWTEDELQELRASAPGFVILAGVEVTGRGGDMLCYGITDPFALPKGISWGTLTREVHRQGGACVAAHPNRWNQPFEKLLKDEKAEIDGIEVLSNNMDRGLRVKAQKLLEKYPHFAQLGNSDSHQPWSVGCCYTDFDADIRTNADLVAAIKARKGVARVNDHDRA
ncbi:MAG: PHP domain-containing protein [Gemmataceae bacterium]|nr:PHP domain-containing protein [Gemmataceae bacterium]